MKKTNKWKLSKNYAAFFFQEYIFIPFKNKTRYFWFFECNFCVIECNSYLSSETKQSLINRIKKNDEIRVYAP